MEKYVANDVAVVSLEGARMIAKSNVKVDGEYLPAIEIRYVDRSEETLSFSEEKMRDDFFNRILIVLRGE